MLSYIIRSEHGHTKKHPRCRKRAWDSSKHAFHLILPSFQRFPCSRAEGPSFASSLPKSPAGPCSAPLALEDGPCDLSRAQNQAAKRSMGMGAAAFGRANPCVAWCHWLQRSYTLNTICAFNPKLECLPAAQRIPSSGKKNEKAHQRRRRHFPVQHRGGTASLCKGSPWMHLTNPIGHGANARTDFCLIPKLSTSSAAPARAA